MTRNHASCMMRTGKRPRVGRESDSNPGECTLHAMSCGAGIGIFFLVQFCRVLLVRSSRACYYPSIYVDETGEPGEGRGHNRPTYLSSKRYQTLQDLYLAHNIAKEVTRMRATSESVIRQFWY
jgi:hypothetical protein